MNPARYHLGEVAIIIHPGVDNVAAVIAEHLPAGTQLRLPDGNELELPQAARRGQSLALRALTAGDAAYSLGAPYGVAARAIAAGEVVDERNLAARLPASGTRPPQSGQQPPPWPADLEPCFRGFRREDGRYGVRNYVGLVTSGMCAATEVREIAARAQRELLSRARYPYVDGIVPIVQESGCGMPDGQPVELLNRLLGDALSHPNLGAALYVDLGCGKTCIACSTPLFRDRLPGYSHRVRHLGIQSSGGTRRTIERGLEMVEELLETANQARREMAPISELILGVKCGGSDRWSGITANPSLGWAADCLIAAGAAVLIGEVPELQGAAHRALRARATSRETARKLDAAQRRYARYARMFGCDYGENPSPGNLAGGLTNIYLKSLGALAKSGSAKLADVLDYGESAGSRRGLMVVYSPGYDQISTPALFLSGAQIVGFTTGRGTGIGCALGPVLKISSNSELARDNEDIDIDAGAILERNHGHSANVTIEQVGHNILDRVLAIANGTYRPRAEASGLHYEFKIWESLWPSI